jgi:hypothetical protein
LFYVESHQPTAIQVKRRKSPDSVEPVSSIRDLLGATLLSQSTKAIFVTTADHFSKEATSAAKLASELKLVQSFELFDFNSFVSLLNLISTNESPPWQSFVNIQP